MTLEEKFQDYIDNAPRNYDFTISPRVLIYDLALIAEKYYVGEVLRPALRADQLEEENADLELQRELQQKAINTLNNSGLKLMEENKKLVSKLANQKTEVGIVEVLKNNFFADEETLKDVMNYDLKRIEKYRKVRLEKLQQVAKEIMEGEATSQK